MPLPPAELCRNHEDVMTGKGRCTGGKTEKVVRVILTIQKYARSIESKI